MVNEKHGLFDIDMQKLVLTYLSKWWVIVLSMLMAFLIAFWYTIYFVTPMYRASVTVYVNNVKRGEQITYISGTNLTAAQQLVNTYIQIIGSDTVLTKVADASGLDLDAEGIRAMLTARQVGDTELFKFFVTHSDPELAARIANAIAEVAPGEIEAFVEGSSTKIIDYAKVPEDPYSPNVGMNCIVGGFVGVLLALLYLTVRFLLDVRIKDEEELTTLFSIPVLGQIPVFTSDNSKRKNDYAKNVYANAAQKGGAK